MKEAEIIKYASKTFTFQDSNLNAVLPMFQVFFCFPITGRPERSPQPKDLPSIIHSGQFYDILQPSMYTLFTDIAKQIV